MNRWSSLFLTGTATVIVTMLAVPATALAVVPSLISVGQVSRHTSVTFSPQVVTTSPFPLRRERLAPPTGAFSPRTSSAADSLLIRRSKLDAGWTPANWIPEPIS